MKEFDIRERGLNMWVIANLKDEPKDVLQLDPHQVNAVNSDVNKLLADKKRLEEENAFLSKLDECRFRQLLEERNSMHGVKRSDFDKECMRADKAEEELRLLHDRCARLAQEKNNIAQSYTRQCGELGEQKRRLQEEIREIQERLDQRAKKLENDEAGYEDLKKRFPGVMKENDDLRREVERLRRIIEQKTDDFRQEASRLRNKMHQAKEALSERI